MRIYIDFSLKKIEKIEPSTMYFGNENVDMIELYFKNFTEGWFATISAEGPDKRQIYPRLADTDGEFTITQDDILYHVFEFTLSSSNGWNLTPGRNLFYIWIEKDNKAQCVGSFGASVVATSGYYLIDNPYVNPVLRDYLDKTFIEFNKNILDGSPKGIYDNLEALQNDFPNGASGIYITLDDGYWNYWNGESWVKGYKYQIAQTEFTNYVDQKFIGNSTNADFSKITAKKMTLQYHDSTTDSTKTGKWIGNLVPETDYAYDLGSSTKYWKGLYAKEINAEKLRLSDSLFAQVDNGIKIYNPISRNTVFHENSSQLQLNKGVKTVFDSKAAYTKIISNEGAAVFDAGQSSNYNYIRLRTHNGTQVFNAHDGAGAIDINNDNLNILANSKINLIPNYSGITTDVDPSMYNRIKIGGEEVVRNDDITESKVTEVIMSYKEAYSGNGQLAKVAITRDGNMYYHGEEVATVDRVKAIEDVIPSQATPINQLADKDFVNSSTSTATATFRGTYNNISDFPLVDVDSNDYLFYDTTDELGNRKFDKYKYSNGEWLYEYTLNNSSFTSEQWKAINSGITKELLDTILNNVNELLTITTELNNSKVNKETVGQLNNLTTTNKNTIVEAINEVDEKKAVKINSNIDSTLDFYNILKLELLDKYNNIISNTEVYLPKSKDALHTSTFIFSDEDTTCKIEGELAGKNLEEKMNIFPYNLMREEEIQLQDSNGDNLDGTDTFIVMPNLWIKTSTIDDGKGWSITFSNQKIDDTYFRAYNDYSISEVLIAKYKANDDGTYLRSTSGNYPVVNLNQSDADAKLPYYNGQKIDSLDYRVRMLYDLLAICYIENRNTQNVYYGMVNYSWGDGNLVNQVGEIAKNGTTSSLGKLATGEMTTFNDTDVINGKRPFAILGVENPYGLIWENISGIVHNNEAKLYAYDGLEHMTPTMMNPSDSNIYYKDTGITISSSGGWQKSFEIYNGYFFPTSVGGTSSKGVGDYYWVNLDGWRIFFVGGYWYAGSPDGLFCLSGRNAFGNRHSYVGFRLSFKK